MYLLNEKLSTSHACWLDWIQRQPKWDQCDEVEAACSKTRTVVSSNQFPRWQSRSAPCSQRSPVNVFNRSKPRQILSTFWSTSYTVASGAMELLFDGPGWSLSLSKFMLSPTPKLFFSHLCGSGLDLESAKNFLESNGRKIEDRLSSIMHDPFGRSCCCCGGFPPGGFDFVTFMWLHTVYWSRARGSSAIGEFQSVLQNVFYLEYSQKHGRKPSL